MAQDRELEVDLVLVLPDSQTRPLGPVRIPEASLRRGESVWHDGVEYELQAVARASGDQKLPQAFCVLPDEPAVAHPILRFVVGRLFMDQKDGFRIFHGKRDVSAMFEVKRMSFEIDAVAVGRKARTRVQLELLAEVEIEAEAELYREAKPSAILALLNDLASEPCVAAQRSKSAKTCSDLKQLNLEDWCHSCCARWLSKSQSVDPRDPVIAALARGGAHEVTAEDGQ